MVDLSDSDSDFDYNEASTYCSSFSSFSQSDEKVKYWIEYKIYDMILKRGEIGWV